MNDNVDEIAGPLHETYCKKVGGLAYNGDSLSSCEEFANNSNKLKRAEAWRGVARKAVNL